MGAAVMPVYLDDNGEPIGKVYLDDNGEPITAKKADQQPAPKPAAKPFKSESGFRGIEAVADAVRAIPDVARNLLSSEARAATLSGAKEGAMVAARDLAAAGREELGGAKDMAVGVGSMLRHPVDTAVGMGGQFVDAAKAIPDVARNLADPKTRAATGKGFAAGMTEGATGVNADEAQDNPLRAIGGGLAMIAGAKIAGSGAGALKRVGGRMTAAAAEAAAKQAAERAAMARVAAGLGGDVPAEVVAEGLAKGPQPVPGSRLVKKPVRTTPTAIADEALADARKPEPAPSVELPPPAFSLGEPPPPRQPRVSVAGGKRAASATGAEVAPPGREGHFTLPEPKAKLTDAQFADVDRRINGKFRTDGGPERRGVPPVETPAVAAAEPPPPAFRAPGIRTVSADGQSVVVRPKPGVAADLRRGVGAEKASKMLGVDREAVQRAAPGPSRRPLAAEVAELDSDYRRRINDERGAIDPKLAVKVGVPVAGAVAGSMADDKNPLAGGALGALTGAILANPAATWKRFNEIRAIAMLSGGALPKSVLGNVGAHLNAAGEMGSLAPIKELLRVPENLKNATAAFKAQTKPGGSMTSGAAVEGLGRANIPGRLMGALDDMSEASLERAGVPGDRARQLQLMEQNPVGAGSPLNRAFQNPVGRFLVPFQRVPVNQFAQGAESAAGLFKKASDPIHNTGRYRAMTGAAIAGGAAAGDNTQDPITLALLAALAGPRALPFAVGAGASVAARKGTAAGQSLIGRIGVGLPDGSPRETLNPVRAIDKPALINWLKYLEGK